MAYNPSVAHIGPDHNERFTLSILTSSPVQGICGIAMLNRQSPTFLLTACLTITMRADRFTESIGQEALMDIVVATSSDNNYWPSTAMENRLRDVWGWQK